MVSRSPKQSPLKFIIIFILAGAVVFLGLKFFKKPEPEPEPEPEISVEEEPEPEPELPELLDFRSVIDSWLPTLKSPKASVGIYIYDLDNKTSVGKYHPDEGFWTASLYKLFVVYEGYRRVENGIDNPDTKIYSGKTISDCLDLAIRQSHSGCAETLHTRIGVDNLYNIIKNDYGLKNSSASGLYSTPREIAKMMEIYYDHTDLSEATWGKIKDSMLNQPPTNNGMCRGACDWRQGLPSGFSTAKVYNKVGWQSNGDGTWKIYDDAAIVELAGHTYIVSIMTNFVYPAEIAAFGSAFESFVLSN